VIVQTPEPWPLAKGVADTGSGSADAVVQSARRDRAIGRRARRTRDDEEIAPWIAAPGEPRIRSARSRDPDLPIGEGTRIEFGTE
jgi:hypothetical protein